MYAKGTATEPDVELAAVRFVCELFARNRHLSEGPVIAEAPEGSLAEPVIYPVAVVANSAHPDEANAFVEFLKTGEAMAVFEAYGFSAGQ